jgi:hypothetical protein
LTVLSANTDLGSTTFPVEFGKVREFAAAVLDDADYRADSCRPVPPTFTMTVALWPSESEGSQPDLGLSAGTIFHGEQEFEYLGDILIGDTLTARSRLSGISNSQTSDGQDMRLITVESRFSNQRGEEVLVSRTVIVQTGGAS